MKKLFVILSKKDIKRTLSKFPSWNVSTKNTCFYKTYKIKNYIEALVFIARISVHAEVLNHHPFIEFSFGKVKVSLKTPELKTVTKLDVALLERIEKLAIN